MGASQTRLEAASRNVANITTPGYKRQIAFSDAMAARGSGGSPVPSVKFRADVSQGKLSATGNPLDVAIGGDGFFQLRDGAATVYSRQGQFSRALDGTLVTPQGYVLQQAGGGDLVIDHTGVTIEHDGTVLDAERPVARIAVYLPDAPAAMQAMDGSAFHVDGGHMAEIVTPNLRQGMVEASNVSVGDEMVTMMAALRQAESGSRLVQTWDDLMGRAITAFGGGQ